MLNVEKRLLLVFMARFLYSKLEKFVNYVYLARNTMPSAWP